MAGMWPIINPNKPLQLHTLLTMGSLLYLLAGCVLFQPSWATKQTKVDLRSTRLWLYLLCGDFCDIMSWTWDPNTDISDIYTCSKRIHYSIPIPQATIPHYFQPSPSARERGCYRDLALKLYRNQPRKSTVPKSELLKIFLNHRCFL